MANIKYSDLLQYVLPELPSVSAPLAELHVRNSVIEFCRRSKVWTVEIDPIDSELSQASYDIDVPMGTVLVDIKAMYFDGDELEPTNQGSSNRTGTGQPRTFYQPTPESFDLRPAPSSVAPITMTLAITPSRTSTSLPLWIAEKYHEGIVAGAKSRLMMIQGRTWSNPQQALLYRSVFEAEVAAAQGDAARTFTRMALRSMTQH